MAAIAEGQSPRAVDYRLLRQPYDPATIFDADSGDIFVVRNVANLVPPFEPIGGRDGVPQPSSMA
jgi:carbonic anhydrase